MKNKDMASSETQQETPGDATAGKPAAEAGAPVRAANEDSPTGGALYRMIARRPSKRIPLAAVLAGLLWLGAVAAFLWGRYGAEGLATLGEFETGAVVAAAAGPLLLIWMLAWTIWRGQEMKLMSEALARTAIRLSDPEDFATGQITTISSAVRRELDAMREGLDAALKQAGELKDLVEREVEEIDRGSGRAEFRTRTMED
ncbi:MAG: hypothetical protein CVT73_20830, partial [Alphaproteobacteria bacterium HGW-Alphaproteobacteria-12]